ncbi:rCG29850 [Rattus norvegicus]|uniref:RCG29850 n=1 Tax=Rattus norvegicus TaxID=10116 RepID=A6IMG0_RAT|nr:rCG29850 [Rattus norvegicus]
MAPHHLLNADKPLLFHKSCLRANVKVQST